MSASRTPPGIEGQSAPEFGVDRWVDSEGEAATSLTLTDMPGKLKLIYTFQSWCPGCHSRGFPTLKKLIDEVGEQTAAISFAVIQTVFEGFETNTFEAMLETQRKYALGVPFAHDDGGGSGSEFMKRYRCGGTPWFVLIGSDGKVAFNDFQLNPDGLIAHLRPQED
jgi:hypothetical protein